MADLKDGYLDDVLDVTQNTRRKFNMIQNEDGTYSFEDVTEYLQVGDSFGAKDINGTNKAVNELYELDYTEAEKLEELVPKENICTAFGKLKLTVKNVIKIIRMLGTTDISKIEDGTVTGILSALNTNINELNLQGNNHC